jgi:hypothetical protein
LGVEAKSNTVFGQLVSASTSRLNIAGEAILDCLGITAARIVVFVHVKCSGALRVLQAMFFSKQVVSRRHYSSVWIDVTVRRSSYLVVALALYQI